MKKKTVKKLELAKETVKNLETNKLLDINGGLMMSYEHWCTASAQLAC